MVYLTEKLLKQFKLRISLRYPLKRLLPFFLFVVMIQFLSQGVALSHPIPFETIDKGDISYYRYGDSTFSGTDMVISDWKTWAWFWKRHTQGIDPLPPIPKIDFRKEMVIVTVLGCQTSGGGPTIEISSIDGFFNHFLFPVKSIRIIVKENRGQGFLDVITNPYHIVKVKKSKSVIFEHEVVKDKEICTNKSECDEKEYCEKSPGNCNVEGICKEKPDVCIEIYDPVCGCDKKTYENECFVSMAGVSILHRGKCEEVTKCMDNNECSINEFCLFPDGVCAGTGVCTLKPEICPLYYSPVCGCDKKTYGNQCDAYANGVSILHTGECTEGM